MDRVLASAPTWAEIIAAAPQAAPPVNREADERTTADLAVILGVSYGQAERWAKLRVRDGTLEKIKRTEGNHELNAWRPVPCDSAA